MAKQLNINLGFTADTSQAAAQIQNLQNQLTGLLNSTNGSMNFGSKVVGDVNKASKAIAELKMHLKNATNVNTGTLDFTKLNESIGKSGITLQQYGDKLRSLGPAGQQAFNALANSVAQSEIPIRRSNAALTEMWTTLKNTARWQISSSILHGFMGSISAAVGYAKDLNKSLNDIRIVTGASVDEMARFAEQANRSAKALSASTTEYTKASLIYYQQGLDDQAVKERTDVTIKMANVSGQTAEMVSDQMTAVWNNFAKGGEDLERFADVMVRLGADTASSSDEIAQGLEKFAAIGDMVGLSFNNAAAALATVTATTRQSADVVGTAFKTIFARIQGLKLGETLEDGTDLNKYSEALATVGISIKEQNGELKDMDTILAEMGAKWKTLSKDQQVALAQTVAGLRQYNQLVALMENFDFYEQNLQSAKNAEGSLQEQADIYAESWQAASDRVKAATQGIYEDLLNDEAFIDVLNIIEKILTYVDNLIDGLGGLGGVLTTIGALLTRAFSAQIAQSMTGMVNGLKSMTAAGREQAQQQKAQFMKDSADAMRGMSDGSNEGNIRAAMMEDQLRLQTSMIENSERMSAEEQQINQMLLDRQRILSENAIAAAKELDAATEAKSDATFNARVELAQEARGWAGGDLEVQKKNLSDFTKQFNQVQQKLKQGITARVNLEELRKLPVEGEKGKQVIDKIKQAVDKIDDAEIKEIVNSLDSMELNAENVEDAIAALTIRLREMQGASETNMMDENNEWMLSEDAVHGLSTAYEDEATAALRARDAEEQANEARDNAANSINNATGAQKTWADQMVAGANVVMSLMSALQAVSGIIDVATNPDMSGWEKFLSIGSSLAMMFVMLAPLLSGTNLQFLAMVSSTVAAKVGLKGASLAALETTAATGALSASLWTLLWPIGLVIAAIAALVAIIWALSNSLNAEENSTKAAEQTLESLSNAYEQAKKRAEAFKETVSNYDSAIEALDGLKKGTQEYIEQLKKANEEARGLIETYGLYDNYYHDSEGIIRFTKGALEEKQNYLDIQAKETKATEYGAKAVVARGKGPDKFAVGQTGSYSDQVAQELFKRIGNGELKVSALEKTTESPTNTNGPVLSELDSYRAALNEITSDLVSTYIPDDAYDATFGLDEARQDLQNILIETFTNQSMREKFANYSLESDENFTQVFDNFQQGYGQYTASKNVDKINEISNGDVNTQAIIENIIANRLSETEAREKNIPGQLVQIKKDAYNADEGDLKKLYKEEIQDLNSGNGIGNVMNDEDLARLYAREVLGREDWGTLSYEGGTGKGTLKDGNTAIEGMDEKSDEEMRRELYQKAKVEELYETVEPEISDEAFFEAIDKITNATGELEQKMGADFSQAILTSLQNGVEIIDFSSILGDISIDELNTLQGIGNSEDLLNQLGLTVEDVTNAGYESAEAFYSAFKNGIDNIDSSDLEAAFDAKLQGMVSKDAEAYELDEENLQEVAKGFQELADSGDKAYENIKDDAEGIADAATRYKRLNNAIEDLNENYKEYSEVLNDVKKATNAVEKNDRASTESAKKLKKSLADLLDTSEELIDTNFLEAIDPNDFQAAASGDEAAINRIRNSFIDAQADALNFKGDIAGLKSALAGLEEGTIINVNETPALEAMIRAMAQAGYTADEIESALSGFGIDCDITPLTSAMAEAASAAQGTGDAIIDNLSMDIQDNSVTTTDTDTKEDVGFDEEYNFSEVKATNMVMKNGADEATPVDTIYHAASKTIIPKKETETENKTQTAHALKVSNAHKSAGGKVASSNKKAAGGGGGGGGKGGGGGGTSSKPAKKSRITKKTDTVDRYKETNDQLNKIKDTIEDTSREMDTLWGSKRLEAMDKYGKSLQKQIQIQEKYKQEIVDSLAIDKKAIQDFMKEMPNGELGGFGDLGLSFNFDENDFITNYTGVMTTLHTKLNEMENYKNSLGTEEAQNEYEDSTLNPFKKRIDELKNLIGQYDDTKQLLMDADNEYQEMIIEQQQNNYEQLEYKIEVRVEINDNDIADIEHQLERIGDNNVYASAERIALIEKNAASYRNIADIQIAAIKEAEQLYITGQISQTDYMTRLQESKEALQEAEMSIREGIEQIGDELENTFDLVDEKLDQQFTKFDQMIKLMDHYKNVVSLTEGEASYKEFNKILKASQEVLRDRIAADESEVAMWTARREQLDADMKNMDKNSPEYLAAEEALNNIMEKEADAKSQLMADIEQLGEYAREIFENSIEQAMKDFEQNLLNGVEEEYLTLNSIIESIEMMNSRQEELLTTTNKIYETNKLIRNIEKDIEATTNNRAKQAYLEFQNKVKQKQEQNELTKFELDLLTAEYEMTKAQIALEEAQNAKDTVRLTRDAEGNYGYVYTANEDKVSDAEQALDDATNNYYNTALEGAQKYQDQIYQHIQEWEEKVKEVYLDQTLSEEEKNKKIEEINDTYNTLIKQDKNLYYMAIGEMQNSAYNKQVDYDLRGIESAENWFTECDGFLSDLEDAQDEYDRNTEEVADHTEENFGRMETSIRNTKIESEKLKNQVVNDLVPKLENELKDSIDEATDAWWKYIEALQKVIELTDAAMQKNSDEKYYNTVDDFSQEIYDLVKNEGYSLDDPKIQELVKRRWRKMGGVDNYDYQAMMNKTEDSTWYNVYGLLRDYKIQNTDWMAEIQKALINGKSIEDIQWMINVRDQKTGMNTSSAEVEKWWKNYQDSNKEVDESKETEEETTTSSPSTTTTTTSLTEEEIKIQGKQIYDRIIRGSYGNGWDNRKAKAKAEFGESFSEAAFELAKNVINGKASFNTGGYTGDWGPEGKLAVLHEKELVLNKQDTENFLSATNILREISQMLDRDALIASLGAINLRAMTLNTPADQVLQQEVTIHADFPNVTDHNEIEIAIDNLINAASQHAYRT